MAVSALYDEKALVIRLRDGDVDAFDIIYWHYHEAIYRNILRLTKDEEAAADLLQDVFVKFWEKRSTLLPDKSVSGLLFVISYHIAINHGKQIIRDLVAKQELSVQSETPDIELVTPPLEAQHQLLEKAIATLTLQKQRVFIRCKLEGKSYEEVGKELGISRYTVKEHLGIAMKSVKTYMHKHSHSLTVSGFLVFLDAWGK